MRFLKIISVAPKKMKLKILITGGTGLVGKALTSLLESQAYDVAYLSRTPPKSNR